MMYTVLAPSQFKIECSLNETGYISSSLSVGNLVLKGN